jgi:hypothetical protein
MANDVTIISLPGSDKGKYYESIIQRIGTKELQLN